MKSMEQLREDFQNTQIQRNQERLRYFRKLQDILRKMLTSDGVKAKFSEDKIGNFKSQVAGANSQEEIDRLGTTIWNEYQGSLTATVNTNIRKTHLRQNKYTPDEPYSPTAN